MKEELLALFNKARLFSPPSYAPKVEIEIEGLKGFDFFIGGSLSDKQSEIEFELSRLLKEYVFAWAKIIDEDPEKKFDWCKFSQDVFDFFKSYNWKEIANEIHNGRKYFDVYIASNGSRLRIKRFGDIIAFKVLTLQDTQREHITGVKAIKALCRADDPSNNQGVYELIHRVNAQLSIPVEELEDNSFLFDFSDINTLLQLALPLAEWNFQTHELVEKYYFHERAVVGQLWGFNIYAELIHGDMRQEEVFDSIKGDIWRRGNAVHVRGYEYQFFKGHDLMLKLSLESSLPNSGHADPNHKFHTEQFVLAEVAAIFCVQLCAMQLSRYREMMASIEN